MSSKNNNFGVTLIEIILTVAIVAILGVSVSAVGSNFLTGNSLENAVDETVSSLRRAQLNAMGGKGDVSWGVKATSGQIILFYGNSFDDVSRDSSFDQTFNVASSISVPDFEVTFNRVTGNPSSAQTVVISAQNGDSATITVNEVGIVDVN